MDQVWRYYGNFQNVRGSFGGLPPWARALVFLAALPGIVLAGLSILALLVSILALLLLTVPVYRVLHALTAPAAGNQGGGGTTVMVGTSELFPDAPAPQQRRRVEATVVDPAPGVDET